MVPHYARDVRVMLRIAIPLALAELGWMGMGVVDTIMVGRLPGSAAAIGAASIGSVAFYSFAIFGLGLMSGLDSLVAQAFGAKDELAARRWLASALFIALFATPVLMVCIVGSVPLLTVIGVDPVVRAGGVEFLNVLVWSVPPLMLYTIFRRYLQGLHHVRPVTFALVSANLVNLLGNWVLIFGHWGAPAMGLRGSALSTVIARIYLAAALLLAVLLRDRTAFTGFQQLRPGIWRLLKLGLPAALTIGFEVGVFNAVTALAGTLGAVSLAAHAIALNAASVTYMVPLGIASAAAVSVGRAVGAGDQREAARAGWTAIGLAVAYELCSALLFIVLPRQIAGAYTHDRAVIDYTATLLAIAAVFQLFDGMQTVATGALRGLGNTVTPMLWNLIGYWVIGLPLGCWLCFGLKWGAAGLWDGLCLALILIGSGLLVVWHRATPTLENSI